MLQLINMVKILFQYTEGMIYIRNLFYLVTIFTDILRVTSVRVNCLVMVTHSKTKMVDFFKKAKLLPQPFRPERQRGREQ